ncbi:hypothetical protein [Klebsiella pneumoniae]|uniref:hypothetical protein n=1 Tax=Klebsiella pneumoniae TaxID=573 RepID=UPI000E2CCD0E|nr:hypothetical protein [Klebsiella pneumoniae]SWM31965.1 Uncharacterised protein [Klebsiella pneumoniae]
MSFQRTIKVTPVKLYQSLAGVQVPEQEEEVIATYTAIRLESMDSVSKVASVYYSISLDNAAVPGYSYVNFPYEDMGNLLAEAEAYLKESLDQVLLN